MNDLVYDPVADAYLYPTVTIHPDDYMRMVAGDYTAPGGSGGGYSEGMPLDIYQGPPWPATVSHPSSSASWYAASQDAWHAAVFGAAQTPSAVSTAVHAYAVLAAQAIAATESAEAAKHHTSAPPIHHVVGEGDQPVYSKASLEPSDQSTGEAAPLAFPDLYKPIPPPDERDDFAPSLEHEWLNTTGLRGPLSVPVAVVAPIHDIFGSADYLTSTQGELSGSTFRTPGLLFDTGSPYSSFANPLGF